MEFHVAWLGVALATVAGMVPGGIIYAPQVLGKVWAKEVGRDLSKIKPQQRNKSMLQMLVTTFITAIAMSMVFSSIRPSNAGYGIVAGLILSWFPISFMAGAVFFEGKSWLWFKISVLTQIFTFAAMGLVLSFFLS